MDPTGNRDTRADTFRDSILSLLEHVVAHLSRSTLVVYTRRMREERKRARIEVSYVARQRRGFFLRILLERWGINRTIRKKYTRGMARGNSSNKEESEREQKTWRRERQVYSTKRILGEILFIGCFFPSDSNVWFRMAISSWGFHAELKGVSRAENKKVVSRGHFGAKLAEW